MKILHTSDLHIGRQLYEFSLLEDQRHMLDWLCKIIEEEMVDALLIAGDIYNRPQPASDAIDLYNEFLNRVIHTLKIPVLAIAGNHDGPSWLGFGSALHKNVGYYAAGPTQLEIPIVSLDDTIDVWLVPYLQPSDVRSLLQQQDEYEHGSIQTFDDAYRILMERNLPRLNPDTFNILMGHGFFSNLSATGKEKELIVSDSENNIGGMDIVDAKYFKAFDYVALGHLHAPQWPIAHHMRYSGSPLTYSLSEENQNKSVTLLEVQGKEFTTKEIPVPPYREVRTVSGTLHQLLEPSYHIDSGFDDYVFAEILSKEEPYAMEKLRFLFPNLLGLQFKSSLVEDLPTLETNLRRERISTEDLFARFYKEMTQEDLPESHRRIVQTVIAELEEESR